MKTKVLFSFLLFLVTSQHSLYGQTNTSENNAIFKEKVYLHLDRSYFNAGDDLWFKSYVVDAAFNMPEGDSTVVYVDLVDNNANIIDSYITKAVHGFGFGDLKLAVNLTEGIYTLRAYTNYMRNFDDAFFFRKNIFIASISNNKVVENGNDPLNNSGSLDSQSKKANKPDLQFFPEGGQLVEGFFNTIAFKILGANGKSIAISGYIKDNSETKITTFKTTHLGMGSLLLKPENNRAYSAVIQYNNNEYTYILPETVQNGTLMQVKDVKDFYYVGIKNSFLQSLDGFYVKVTHGNYTLYNAQIKGNQFNNVIKIPKADLNYGILKFALYTNDNNIISERLAYNDKTLREINTIAKTAFASYETNKNIELLIDTKGALKNSIEGANMSISVIDNAATQPNMIQPDIRTYLLLNSELKGTIEQPEYYFYSNDPKRKQNLDLLMLTQGWRQYLYDDHSIDKGKIFNKETGITISGTVKRSYNVFKTAIADVSLFYKKDSILNFSKIKTDSNGKFSFNDIIIMDGEKIALKANDKDHPKHKFIIELDSKKTAPINKNIISQIQGNNYGQFLSTPDAIERLDDVYVNEQGRVILNEIKLKNIPERQDSRIKNIRKVRRENSYYSNASNTIDFEKLRNMYYPNLLDAIRGRIPGVFVFQDKVTVRGPNSINETYEPLYLLNGVPIDSSILTLLPANEVDFIDVLKGSKASIYGMSGGSGVFAIYTLKGVDSSVPKYDKNGAALLLHQGFSYTRKFYEPAYSKENESTEKLQGITLFWTPIVTLDKEGQARINFSSGNLPGVYQVNLEGITPEGTPLTAKTSFTVE